MNSSSRQKREAMLARLSSKKMASQELLPQRRELLSESKEATQSKDRSDLVNVASQSDETEQGKDASQGPEHKSGEQVYPSLWKWVLIQKQTKM